MMSSQGSVPNFLSRKLPKKKPTRMEAAMMKPKLPNRAKAWKAFLRLSLLKIVLHGPPFALNVPGAS